jgi:hypothetical protein
MTNRHRLVGLAAVILALAATVVAGASDSTGQTQGAPGVTYGGLKDQYAAWLRVDPGRRSVAALLIEWAVAPDRCSNKRSYSSTLYAGYEEFQPIQLSAEGGFKKTIVDRYKDGGSRFEETQTVVGSIDGHVAVGSISGRAKIVKPDGRVVRCNFGPQAFRLVD